MYPEPEPSIRDEIQRIAARINTERWPEADGNERAKLTEAHTLLERADYQMKRADEYREQEES
jgi:hypothetical protein